MAKKYLLYIHDERFANEPRKSELVNTLLTRHYGDKAILEVSKALDEAPVPTDNRYGIDDKGEVFGPITLPKKISGASRVEAKTCKNGHPIPDGRDRCMGKGCKYA